MNSHPVTPTSMLLGVLLVCGCSEQAELQPPEVATSSVQRKAEPMSRADRKDVARAAEPRRELPQDSARDEDNGVSDSATESDVAEARRHYQHAMVHHDLSELELAIADYSAAIRLDRTFTAAHHDRGTALAEQGEYERAIADYSRAIELDASEPAVFDDLAWLLATCPFAKHRNAQQAVVAARRACELTQWKDWDFLTTLAAANAEAGDFGRAVHWQAEAVGLASDSTDKQDGRELLTLFRQGKPYREPLVASENKIPAESPIAANSSPSASDVPGRSKAAKTRAYAENLMRLYDANQDGVLDSEETQRLGGDWLTADRNGDDVLSIDEMAQRFVVIQKNAPSPERRPSSAPIRTARLSKEQQTRLYARNLLQLYDADKNGSLDRSEWKRMKGSWEQADRNRDDVISLTELRYRLGSYQSRSSPAAPSTRFLTPTERLPDGLPAWFRQRDANADGQVAMSEFATQWDDATLDEFKRHDLNGDGFITSKECKEADQGER